MISRSVLSAVGIELTIYKLVLFCVVLPVFGLVTPTFLVHQAVVDAYRFARRLAALVGNELKPVEQLNFEGHAFLFVAAAFMLLALIAFAAQFAFRLQGGRGSRALPDASGDRRFREVPERLKRQLEEKVRRLWLDLSTAPEIPQILCFASTGLSACVTETGGRAAIALSTGLIDQMSKGEDRLANVIVLHEMAHIVGGDLPRFRALTAFVAAYRRTFLTLLGAAAVISVVSTFVEYFDLAGIEQRGPSLAAYLTRTVRDLVFCYASIVLVLRYIALIVMLTELRADLRAAMAVGGLGSFASIVRSAGGVRASSRRHLIQSWIGTRVTHLTADERLSLLEVPRRLFTPKYRYFAASIVLSIFLILDGSLAFSGFDWVLQVAIVATVAALNAITMAMLFANNLGLVGGIGFPRRIATAAIVVAANLLFLFSPAEVMGRTGTMIVAISDPNFSYDAGEFKQLLGEWYEAVARPAIDTLADGRALSWTFLVFFAMWIGEWPSTTRKMAASVVAGLVAALSTAVVAAGAPIATYLLLPGRLWQSRDQIVDFMSGCGPAIPVLLAAAIGMATRVFTSENEDSGQDGPSGAGRV